MAAPTSSPTISPPPDIGAPITGASSAQPESGGSTVRALRMRAVLLAVLIATFAVVGTVAGLVSRNATESVRTNTAPSLVAVQDLFASVAESNTAATGAFLSAIDGGNENRLQRNLYEDALRRASDKTEEVASLVGDNEISHDALREISASLTSYSGQIEAARLAVELDEPGAESRLRSALVQTQTNVDSAVQTIAAQMQSQLDVRSEDGRILTYGAIALGVVCLLALVLVQLYLFRTTNRVLNLPLLLGTVLILLTTLALARSAAVRQGAIDNALDGGYGSITTTAEIQRAAYALQSESNLTLLGTSTGDIATLEAEVDLGIAQARDNADSLREQAAAAELESRWARYLATPRNDPNLQFANFNGLNTSIESVLSDNTAQFNEGVASAAGATRNAPIYIVIGSVLALLACLYGLQLRLGEYS